MLPKYRGLMPSFWVLKNKEFVTGVSVFFVDEGIDSGPILVRKNILEIWLIRTYNQDEIRGNESHKLYYKNDKGSINLSKTRWI